MTATLLVHLLSRVGPIRRDEQIVAPVSITVDVTDRKRAEQKPGRLNEELEEINASLSLGERVRERRGELAVINEAFLRTPSHHGAHPLDRAAPAPAILFPEFRQTAGGPMITILAHLRLHPGSETEADEAFLEMAAAVEANEPGAWIYTMHRSHDDPLDVYVYEVYEDEEAFGLHINTDYIEKLRNRLSELADPSFSTIRVLEPVAGFARPAP